MIRTSTTPTATPSDAPSSNRFMRLPPTLQPRDASHEVLCSRLRYSNHAQLLEHTRLHLLDREIGQHERARLVTVRAIDRIIGPCDIRRRGRVQVEGHAAGLTDAIGCRVSASRGHCGCKITP